MKSNVNYMRRTVSRTQFDLIKPLEGHYHQVGSVANGVTLLIDQWVRPYVDPSIG